MLYEGLILGILRGFDFRKLFYIQGGSWVSTGDSASRFARFAFRRHFFQHAGFRVCRSIPNKDGKTQVPARLLTTDVYVLGVGIQGRSVSYENVKH